MLAGCLVQPGFLVQPGPEPAEWATPPGVPVARSQLDWVAFRSANSIRVLKIRPRANVSTEYLPWVTTFRTDMELCARSF